MGAGELLKQKIGKIREKHQKKKKHLLWVDVAKKKTHEKRKTEARNLSKPVKGKQKLKKKNWGGRFQFRDEEKAGARGAYEKKKKNVKGGSKKKKEPRQG